MRSGGGKRPSRSGWRVAGLHFVVVVATGGDRSGFNGSMIFALKFGKFVGQVEGKGC